MAAEGEGGEEGADAAARVGWGWAGHLGMFTLSMLRFVLYCDFF
jgi:hypothetical protein